MQAVDMYWSSVEEANLPEKLSKESLKLWKKSRRKLVRFDGYDEEEDKNFTVDLTPFLLADQHQQGLSHAIKRCRKYSINLPDLLPKTNANLPTYLQDVERHNPELMNHTKTTVRCTLPDLKVIEEEKRLEEISAIKSWKHGLVIHENSSLIDPNWEKATEERYVGKLTQSPSVMAGVLQQWQR